MARSSLLVTTGHHVVERTLSLQPDRPHHQSSIYMDTRLTPKTHQFSGAALRAAQNDDARADMRRDRLDGRYAVPPIFSFSRAPREARPC
jgi:hypothetical protein